MRQITMCFMDVMSQIHVTFMEGQRQVGRHWKFLDESCLVDILRAGHGTLEDHALLEHALKSKRPGRVALRLTEEQYQDLVSGRGRRRNEYGDEDTTGSLSAG